MNYMEITLFRCAAQAPGFRRGLPPGRRAASVATNQVDVLAVYTSTV
jgi:hypothetical protein